MIEENRQPLATPADDDVIISIRGIGKMYRIYDRPQDRLKQMLWRGRRQYGHEFWALHDISFDVRKGDRIGILGRNGNGKSTLLQIIAGTLQPTTGTVMVKGRVAALLELGSGFNPDFTGRENVFLNGAILGISRTEMEQRFDAIAAFADIGEFIDQPVKVYSSGMFARLAFAVAISVDPDILIIDEILSVGDIQFQQKCISRLREMTERGLTLLYVSHSIDSIKSVCNRGLVFSQGCLIYEGSAEQASDMYLNFVRDLMNEANLSQVRQLLDTPVKDRPPLRGNRRYGTGHVTIEEVRLTDEHGEDKLAFVFGETIVLDVTYRSSVTIDQLSVSFLVRDATGVDLMGTTTFDEQVVLPALQPGEYGRVKLTFVNVLRAGSFGISVAVHRPTHRDYSDNVLLDQIDGAAAFEVLSIPERPIHYKFHCPVIVTVQKPMLEQMMA